MKKLKVLTVVGTRPEIIRLSRIISLLNHSESIDHVLVHTGQNYDFELNEIFFKDLDIAEPKYFMDAAGKTPSETIGNVIIKIDQLLEKETPDVCLILGDTNSCLAAIPAKRRKIPVFHMEAGNRCFDQRVPEEINRKIVDHISDINLTYSDIAREYLLREGFPSDRIIKTGSPMFEVLEFYKNKIVNSGILKELGLKKEDYFVVSSHREENVSSDKFENLVSLLNELAERYKIPVVVSTHPRTRKIIEEKGIKFNNQIRLLKPLGFTDYINLQMNSRVVLSDSGTISEEASILNFRGINIREAHERPEAMEEASVIMTGFNVDRVIQAIGVLTDQPLGDDRKLRLVSDYSMPNVSEKVLRILLSYTDYVNRVVWFKQI
jgi:UDP-N-acetyl-L-fucosamine synthase